MNHFVGMKNIFMNRIRNPKVLNPKVTNEVGTRCGNEFRTGNSSDFLSHFSQFVTPHTSKKQGLILHVRGNTSILLEEMATTDANGVNMNVVVVMVLQKKKLDTKYASWAM